MSFTSTELVDGGVLVVGTDSKGVEGATILRSQLWTQVKKYRAQQAAQNIFDDEVEKFFKPLTDAAAAFEDEIDDDPDAVVVLNEEIEGVDHVDADKVRLDNDGIILRILEEGDTNRLLWVNGHLVAVKA